MCQSWTGVCVNEFGGVVTVERSKGSGRGNSEKIGKSTKFILMWWRASSKNLLSPPLSSFAAPPAKAEDISSSSASILLASPPPPIRFASHSSKLIRQRPQESRITQPSFLPTAEAPSSHSYRSSFFTHR